MVERKRGGRLKKTNSNEKEKKVTKNIVSQLEKKWRNEEGLEKLIWCHDALTQVHKLKHLSTRAVRCSIGQLNLPPLNPFV